MANEQEQIELQEQLRKKVVGSTTEIHNDMQYLRTLQNSRHARNSACDRIFDAVEQALIQTIKEGIPLQGSDPAYDAIGDIAWATVTYLCETARARIELEKVLEDKCAELVKGSTVRQRKTTQEAETVDFVLF